MLYATQCQVPIIAFNYMAIGHKKNPWKNCKGLNYLN